MSVLESMACGTPAVIQDLPEYDPTVFVHEQTVLKFSPRHPEALARALLRLAHDSALRETLGSQGPAVAREHADYNSEMARLETLYRSVIKPKRLLRRT